MKQLRRLDVSAPQDTYARAKRCVLRSFDLTGAEFRALQRKRPELVVIDGEALLLALPFRGVAVDLCYAFPGRDAFVQQFSPMFERLLPAVRQEEAPLGFRFDLLDRSSRPYVEPVLTTHAFEVSREWMRMALVELPDAGPPRDKVASGFVLRAATPKDAETIAELDAAAFPIQFLTAGAVPSLMTKGRVFRILEETSTRRAAGLLMLRIDEAGVGHVSTLAVHPNEQRRGLGEALLRWALAWLRKEGVRRATLYVDTDNAPAIALYRKLGFAPADFGLSYRRPIDEEEVRQVVEKRRGSLIKFGGWR